MIRIYTILILCLLPSLALARNLGGPPLYQELDKSDIAIGIPADIYNYGARDAINFKQIIISEVVVSFGDNYVNETISFVNDLTPLPEGSTFRIVFLSTKNNPYEVVNLLCSSIPVSISETEFISACKSENVWEALAEIVKYESDSECLKRQALALSTSPAVTVQKAWEHIHIKEKSFQQKNLLAFVAIGLAADDINALKILEPVFHDLSDLGTTELGEDPYATWLRGGIVAWVHKNASSENALDLLDFALSQSGIFQGRLLIGIASKIPKSELRRISPLLLDEEIMVQYAAVQIVAHMLNQGENIPNIEVFTENPVDFVSQVTALIDREY